MVYRTEVQSAKYEYGKKKKNPENSPGELTVINNTLSSALAEFDRPRQVYLEKIVGWQGIEAF